MRLPEMMNWSPCRLGHKQPAMKREKRTGTFEIQQTINRRKR